MQPISSLLALLLFATPAALAAQKKLPDNGPKATVIRETTLYVSPDKNASRLAPITPGREMVVVEHNGPWLRVFANTDAQASRAQDAPVFGGEADAPPISGWVDEKGIVTADTPKGDLILFGTAVTQEAEANQPHSGNAAQAARLLYERMADLFPQSPLVPEATWRAADIRWQLQKQDISTRPSAQEKEAYLRQAIDDEEMRKIEKKYPQTKWADLAAWAMIDNKLCGDWQGTTKCPEKEAELYEKYAKEHPTSPKAPQALYEAAYRYGALTDMYNSDGDSKKADQSKARAMSLAGDLQGRYPQTDTAARAASLVYRLQQSIPIYGIERE